MENVSSSNGLELYPKLRFPEFTEPWEKHEFGSIIKEVNDKTIKENEDILLSAAIEGMFLNSELFGHQRGASNKGYKKIKMNTLVLSTQNLHLGNANVNTRFEHGMVSPAYKTYEITDCVPEFLSEWIKSYKAKKFFFNATTVGASVCRRNVEWDTLYSQHLLLPSVTEQKKISGFLHLLSKRIQRQNEYVENLKKYKRGLIQSYFDENTKWEKIPFWDCVKIASSLVDPTKEPYRNMKHIGTANIEKYTGHLLPCKRAFEEGITSGKYFFTKKCVIYSKIRPELSKVALPDFDGICSADAYPLKVRSDVLPEIVYYELLSERFIQYAKKTSIRTKMPKINQEELASFDFIIPPIDVQRNLIGFLQKIDKIMRLYEDDFLQTRAIMNALLQQLFI